MAHHHYMLVAPKSYPSSLVSSTYSIDSILNPQPWYNDFVNEDPPEDEASRNRNIRSSETLPHQLRRRVTPSPQPSRQKITYDIKDETWKVACEEGLADKTSLELIQKINDIQGINDKFNGSDQKAASLTDTKISFSSGKINETDSDDIQKQSVRENQMSSVAANVLSLPKEILSEELRQLLLKATIEELDKIKRETNVENNEFTFKNIEESAAKQTAPAHAEPIYNSDKNAKGKRGKGYWFRSWKSRTKPHYKTPGIVNILENNIRIRRSKDEKGFRISLVSPNTTFGGAVAMTTNVNNSVTMGMKSSVSMKTEPVLSVGQLCQEYVLTETVLRDATLSQKGYLNLTKRNKD